MAETRPLAVVTGASTGIGYELAKVCVENGYDLVIAADEPAIERAASDFRGMGARVEAVQTDLATTEGVERLTAAAQRFGRPVDALFANAGVGLGDDFLDQDFAAVKHLLDTNVTGTIYLVQKIARDMRARNHGRILITGSIAGRMPGPFHAVYNASKAFLESFAFALREELRETDVVVFCLMPGATDTPFFERAGLTNTAMGESDKDDPAKVARAAFDALMRGEGDLVPFMHNKMMALMSHLVPESMLARTHRQMAEPRSGERGRRRDWREARDWRGGRDWRAEGDRRMRRMTQMARQRTADGSTARMLAESLGWFSLALGAVEVLAGDWLGEELGMKRHAGLIRAFGAREIAAGAVVLGTDHVENGMWARVAGDALDIAALSTGLEWSNPQRDKVGMALAAVAGVTALDVATGLMLHNSRNGHGPARRPRRHTGERWFDNPDLQPVSYARP